MKLIYAVGVSAKDTGGVMVTLGRLSTSHRILVSRFQNKYHRSDSLIFIHSDELQIFHTFS